MTLQITIVSSVFSPEPIISARTSMQIAGKLAQDGHQVRVITSFPNRPTGRRYPGFHKHFFKLERAGEGFNILRCLSYFSNRSSMVDRFFENLSFGVSSGLALLTGPKPGVVYANTWPIFSQGIVSLICRLRGIPVVLSVQDIYPESLLVQNRLKKSSMIFKFLRWIDALIAKNSAALIVISDRFREFYIQDRKLSPEKAHVIPNWVDEAELTVDPPGNPIRASHKIPEDAFLAVYAGNVGAAAGVEDVIQAYAELMEHKETYLLVTGDGSKFEDCLKLAEVSKNDHILFHRPWSFEETSTVLGAADLCILPTQGEQSLVSVPSKLLSYMLASRPIAALALPDSEVARIVSDSGCGWVISPGDLGSLASLIVEISALSKEELVRRGRSGRDFAMKYYSKEVNLKKVIKILEWADSQMGNTSRITSSPEGI